MILADLYLRMSDGRNENGSFVEREKALRGKASTRGWTVHRVVIENDLIAKNGKGGNGKSAKSASAFKRRKVGVYPDGRPKMRMWRPGFRSVLDDLSAGRVQAVLAEDLDRMLRDPRDFEDLLDVIRYRGAWADSLSGSLRFTAGGTDAEEAMARVMMTMARKSSQDTGRRVADGRRRTAAAGQWAGGPRPYGFTPVPHPSGNHRNTQLAVCEAEADVIRNAVEQLHAGVSLRSVAKNLRDRGVPTVTGAAWSSQTLRDILRRPLNVGIIVDQGRTTDVRLPGAPILDDDVWQGVKALLEDPERATPGRAPCWLGSGLYRCVCGGLMEIQRGKGRAAGYRCDPDARPADAGTGHVRRNAEHLDAFVVDTLLARLARPDAAEAFARPAASGPDLAALRRKAKALAARKLQINRMWGDEEIDDIDYAAARKANEAKLAAIAAQVAAAGTDTSPVAVLLGADDIAAAWAGLSLGQQRAILAEACVVTVRPTRRTRGFDVEAVDVAFLA